MRRDYIVAYDVADAKRLRRVYKVMRGYGQHLQLSVFRCELDPREKIELVAKLGAGIDHDADQILFVDIGPTNRTGNDCIEALGKPHTREPRRAIVT